MGLASTPHIKTKASYLQNKEAVEMEVHSRHVIIQPLPPPHSQQAKVWHPPCTHLPISLATTQAYPSSILSHHHHPPVPCSWVYG